MNLPSLSRDASTAGSRRSVYDDLGLSLLSAGSGCTDVLAFLKLGGLFTSAMTGNTALLLIALGRGRLLAASRSLCALLAFAIGVALAAAVLGRSPEQEKNRRRALTRLLSLELIFLGCCAGLWAVNLYSVQGKELYAVIALSALSMGIQATAARASKSPGISTIVFTSNLINILIAAIHALERLPATEKRPGSHLFAFATYAGGAALAAFLVYHYLEAVIWIPASAVLLALGCFKLAR